MNHVNLFLDDGSFNFTSVANFRFFLISSSVGIPTWFSLQSCYCCFSWSGNFFFPPQLDLVVMVFWNRCQPSIHTVLNQSIDRQQKDLSSRPSRTLPTATKDSVCLRERHFHPPNFFPLLLVLIFFMISLLTRSWWWIESSVSLDSSCLDGYVSLCCLWPLVPCVSLSWHVFIYSNSSWSFSTFFSCLIRTSWKCVFGFSVW